MKTALKSVLAVAATTAAIAGTFAASSAASAFSRPTYSISQINNGALGFGNDGTVTFNSIIYDASTDAAFYAPGMLQNETNFVGARVSDGAHGINNRWNGTSIDAVDGETYVVRLYVHNNAAGLNGQAGKTATGVKVRFYVPYASSTEVAVNGWLTAANASPNTYLDDVVFKSTDGTPFHLEYVDGSALLENGGFANGAGVKLTDSVVNQKAASIEDSWTTIGYSGLNGEIPGCYAYVNYVTIKVKVVYDRDFTIEKKVRIVGDTDKTWKDTVEAKVGDKVEFQILYTNVSDSRQNYVTIRDILPANLRYVKGSSTLYNVLHPTGTVFDEDALVENGVVIGSYGANSNAYVRFTAEVVDENLACGYNALVNWGRGTVGDTLIQDYATVRVGKVCDNEPTVMPSTGPESIIGGVVATGAVATAAGYYIASRRQMRKN